MNSQKTHGVSSEFFRENISRDIDSARYLVLFVYWSIYP